MNDGEDMLLRSSILIVMGSSLAVFGFIIIPAMFGLFQNTFAWELFDIPSTIIGFQAVCFAVSAVALIPTGIPWFCLSVVLVFTDIIFKAGDAQ